MLERAYYRLDEMWLSGVRVTCRYAVAFVATVDGLRRWHVVVYDPQEPPLDELDAPRILRALTTTGERLEGRVLIGQSEAAITAAYLKGAGPLGIFPAARRAAAISADDVLTRTPLAAPVFTRHHRSPSTPDTLSGATPADAALDGFPDDLSVTAGPAEPSAGSHAAPSAHQAAAASRSGAPGQSPAPNESATGPSSPAPADGILSFGPRAASWLAESRERAAAALVAAVLVGGLACWGLATLLADFGYWDDTSEATGTFSAAVVDPWPPTADDQAAHYYRLGQVQIDGAPVTARSAIALLEQGPGSGRHWAILLLDPRGVSPARAGDHVSLVLETTEGRRLRARATVRHRHQGGGYVILTAASLFPTATQRPDGPDDQQE